MDTMIDFLLNHQYSFWYGLAAFLIFIALFSKFGIKPIIKALDAREEKIKRELEESESAYKRAKEMQADLDKQLKGAEAKIAELMAESRRDGEEQKKTLVAQGGKEIEDMRTKALREIDAARHEAIVSLREEVAEISTTVAEKIVKQELDGGQYQTLVNATIDAFEARKDELN